MTYTHISHFGLTISERSTERNIVLLGSKVDCLRMAYAHGFETEAEDHNRETNQVNGYHMTNQDNKRAYVKKWNPTTWALLMDRTVWDSER